MVVGVIMVVVVVVMVMVAVLVEMMLVVMVVVMMLVMMLVVSGGVGCDGGGDSRTAVISTVHGLYAAGSDGTCRNSGYPRAHG